MRWCARCSTRRDDDRTLREALNEAAAEADETLVAPLLEFRNFGVPLPHNWTTVVNSAEFGTDYYTRTAVAKSNIFINRPRETRYFYQDLDQRRRAAQRRQALHRDLQASAAGQGLLVDHPLRPVPFLRAERDRPLLARHQEQGTCASRPTAR